MAQKPSRLKASQIYPLVHGVPVRRAQSFDFTSNYTIDSVYELGNSGIVEDSISAVESGISLNTNEWGNTDLEALMFNKYQQRNAVATTGNTTGTLVVAGRGAGGDWSSYVTAGKWLLVHRFNMNATTNSAEYVKVKTATYDSTEKVNVYTLSPTYQLSAQATGGDIVGLVNSYTITQGDVDSKPVHFVVPHRYSSVATTVLYSVILPRCSVDNLTYSFDVSGAAEQNYSLVGEEQRMVLSSRAECYSVAGSFISYDSTTGSVVFTIPRDNLGVTASPYLVYADSNLVDPTGTISHTSGAMTIEAVIGAGLNVDSTSQLVYYYTLTNKIGYKEVTNITSSIGRLVKDYIEVWLGTSSVSEEKLLRCSGISLSIPLTRETIEELGNSRPVEKPLEGNLRNEITLTFSRNDLREYAMILGESSSFDSDTLSEVLMSDLKAVKNAKIVIKLYNHPTTHDSTTLLKTFTFENCNFIGDNATTPISGAAGLEMTFSSQSLNFVGSGLPPIYS